MKIKLTGQSVTLLLSSMMTMMAAAVVAPALPLISKDFSYIQGYELLVRMLITLPAATIAITAPLAGYICDRAGRRVVLQFGLFLYIVAGTAGFYLTDLYAILVSRAILGVAIASIMTSVVTLIGDYYSHGEREAFMGLQGAFFGIGGIIFMSLAGILANIGWHWPFLIYGFSLPILIMSFRYIRNPDVYGKDTARLAENGDEVSLPHGVIWFIYFTGFIGIVFFFMVPVQVPFLLAEAGIDEKYIGMMISLMTLSSSVIAMNYRRFSKRMRFPAIIGLAFLLIGTGFLLMSRAGAAASFAAALLVTGLGVGLMMPTSSLWIMHVVGVERRGRYVGRLTTAMFVGQFVSPVIVQPLVSNYQVYGAFRIISVVLLCMGLVYILIRKQAMKS